MYTILLHTHSILRYAIFALMLLVIYRCYLGYNTRKLSSKKAKRLSTYTLIAFHSQIVLGIILYFLSPKVAFTSETMKHSLFRFFTVEHPSMMLIAGILITVGHVLAKQKRAMKSHRSLIKFYIIAILLIIISIPWPFRSVIGGGWL